MKCEKVPLTDFFWFQEGPGVRKWQFTNSGIKLLNVANIVSSGDLDLSKTDRYLSSDEVENRYKHFLVDEGDLVIASSGISFDTDGLLRTRGAFAHRTHLPLCLNTSTIRFKAKKDADLRYLRYWLDSFEFRSQITRLVTGSAQQNFGPSHIESINISLPELNDQEAIVKLLDRANRLRRLHRYAFEMSESFLMSAFLELFGDITEMNKKWDLDGLDNLGVLDRGRSKHRPRDAKHLYGGLYPFIQTGDVANADRYIRKHSQTYSEEGLKQSNLWPVGTLCITIAANIADTAILTYPACFPDSIVGFIPEDRISVEFVQYWLKLLQASLERTAPEVAQKNINLEILRNLHCPIPPKPFQKKFVDLVVQHDRMRIIQAESLRQAEHLFQSLLHQAFNEN